MAITEQEDSMSMPPFLKSLLMINQRKSRAQERQQEKIMAQDKTKTKNPKQRNLEVSCQVSVFISKELPQYHSIIERKVKVQHKVSLSLSIAVYWEV